MDVNGSFALTLFDNDDGGFWHHAGSMTDCGGQQQRSHTGFKQAGKCHELFVWIRRLDKHKVCLMKKINAPVAGADSRNKNQAMSELSEINHFDGGEAVKRDRFG